MRGNERKKREEREKTFAFHSCIYVIYKATTTTVVAVALQRPLVAKRGREKKETRVYTRVRTPTHVHVGFPFFRSLASLSIYIYSWSE